MGKIVLSLTKLGRSGKVALATTIEAKAAQVPGFPTPNPKQVELLAARDGVRAKEQARNAQEAALRAANAELVAAEERLDTALIAHARLTEEVTNGDDAKITLLGYSVAGAPQAVGPMPLPENLAATAGDNEGELDAAWNRIYGAKSYEVQSSADPITEASWTHALVSGKSAATVGGLPSGRKRWLRVRAIGAQGPGPWSDPACCMVP